MPINHRPNGAPVWREQRRDNQPAVPAALATISVATVLAGRSTAKISSFDALPHFRQRRALHQLPPRPLRWYEYHQMAAAPNRDAVATLCVAGQQSERPDYEGARQADHVHTAMGEAVDLTRWMAELLGW